MDGSTTQNLPRSERCRKNAQDKSARKRQAAFAALAALQREGRPITKTAVARRAGTSVVFLRAHPDLRLAIEEADRTRTDPPPAPSEQTKDHLVAALRRRLDTLKQTLEAREATLRDKQREIDQLSGKLATGSPLTDAELRHQIRDALTRLALIRQPCGPEGTLFPDGKIVPSITRASLTLFSLEID